MRYWPLIALAAIGLLLWYHRKATDKGLGDTVSNTLKGAGITPTPGCGCEARQSAMNDFFPYL